MSHLQEGKIYIFNALYSPNNIYIIFEIISYDNGNNIIELIKDGYLKYEGDVSDSTDYYVCRPIYNNFRYKDLFDNIFLIDKDESTHHEYVNLNEFIIKLQIEQFLDTP